MSETNGQAPLFDDGQTLTAFIAGVDGVHPAARITFRRWTAGYGRPFTAKIERAVTVNAAGVAEPDDEARAKIANEALLGRLFGICSVDAATGNNIPVPGDLTPERLDDLHELLYSKIYLTVKGFKASDPDPQDKTVIPTAEDDLKNSATASAT